MTTYPSKSTTKRSASVKVQIHPDVLEKLRELAESLGQAPATLASIAVSQYVVQQTRSLVAAERATEGLIAGMGPEMTEMLRQNLKGLK